MSDSTLSFNILATDNATRTVGKIGQSFGNLHMSVGKVMGGLVALGPALAGLAVGAGIKQFVDDARESARVGRLTAQVIKSTGGAAKVTADQVGDLATAISNKTGADDEAIQSGQNLLLTFTNIRNGVGKGNDIFNQASQAITDMTAAMNGGEVTAEGMKTSSIQLGKALNDPIKGVTALQKVGVSFTAKQKEQIKTLVDSGKTMEAQKIILGELSKEFGGAAQAASDPLTKLKTIAGNLSEQIGGYLLPVVDKFATFLGSTAIPFVSKMADQFAAKLSPKVKEFGQFIDANVLPALMRFGDFITKQVLPVAGKIVEKFAGIGGKIVKAIGKIDVSGIADDLWSGSTRWASRLIAGFKTGVEKGDWKPLGQAIGNGLSAALEALGKTSGKLLDSIGKLIDKVDWSKLGGKISNGILGLIHSVDWGKIGGAIGDAFITAVQKTKDISVKIGNSIKAFVNAVNWEQVGHDSTDAIGRFLQGIDWASLAKSLGKLAISSLKLSVTTKGTIEKAIGDALTGIYKSLAEWSAREWPKLGAALWDGIKTGVVAGAKAVGGWLKSTFVDPIINHVKWGLGIHSPSTVFAKIGLDLIAGFKNGVVSAVKGIGNWISRTLIAPVVGAFVHAGSWLVQHGRNAVAGFRAGVSAVAAGIGRWMYDHVISPLVAPFGKAGSWLNSAGRNVIAGFKAGMVAIWGDVTKWVSGIATWIKDHKGPVSLDGRLLIPAGRAIMSGFLKGLKSGAGPAWGFVQSVGGKTVDMLRSALGAIDTGIGSVPLASGMSKLVQQIANSFAGWGSGYQWNALYKLIMGESGFRPNAQNPTSTAYGLFQFLNSTWGSVGGHKTSDPTLQTIYGLKYIKAAYGTPAQAYAAWSSRSPHWYEKGTPWVPNDQLAYLHEGEAVLPRKVNEARLAGMGGGPVVIEVRSGGTRVDDLLVEVLRRSIKAKGGNVQAVLGK